MFTFSWVQLTNTILINDSTWSYSAYQKDDFLKNVYIFRIEWLARSRICKTIELVCDTLKRSVVTLKSSYNLQWHYLKFILYSRDQYIFKTISAILRLKIAFPDDLTDVFTNTYTALFAE